MPDSLSPTHTNTGRSIVYVWVCVRACLYVCQCVCARQTNIERVRERNRSIQSQVTISFARGVLDACCYNSVCMSRERSRKISVQCSFSRRRATRSIRRHGNTSCCHALTCVIVRPLGSARLKASTLHALHTLTVLTLLTSQQEIGGQAAPSRRQRRPTQRGAAH